MFLSLSLSFSLQRKACIWSICNHSSHLIPFRPGEWNHAHGLDFSDVHASLWRGEKKSNWRMWFYWRLPDATGKRKMIHTVLILYGNSFIAPFCHQQSQSLILKHPFASQKVLSLKITSASCCSWVFHWLNEISGASVSFPLTAAHWPNHGGRLLILSSDVVLFVLANNTRQTHQCLSNLCCSRNKASSSSSVREQRKQLDIAAHRQQTLIGKQSYSSNHGSHDLPDASAVLF